MGRYQVLVVEDADRVTERGADALLKSIEEPAPRTVWLLCAPTADDVVATIRSRCRLVELSTPSTAAIAELLQQPRRHRPRPRRTSPPGSPRATSAGPGRWPATRAARIRRAEVLRLPTPAGLARRLPDAAANVVEAATEEAAAVTGELDAREKAELSEALGFTTKGARPRNAQAALRDLEDQQKARAQAPAARRARPRAHRTHVLLPRRAGGADRRRRPP